MSESAQGNMMGRTTNAAVVPNGHTACRILVVDIADMAVSDDPSCELVTYSLGSCLGVAIYDPAIRLGGMAHCMLPLSMIDPEKAKEKPCMFVDTGVLRLLKQLFDRGLKRSRAIVKIAGCAKVFETGGVFRIGERNCAVLRKVLWKNDLLIAAEDIGGDATRTLRLDIGSGRFLLKRGKETFEL